MTQYLFLRILDVEQATATDYKAQWLLTDAQANALGQNNNPSELSSIAHDLPGKDKDRKIIILLPGHSILICQAQIKPQHMKHLDSAIADAIEEQLAETVEEVHIAYKKTGHIVPVSATSQSFSKIKSVGVGLPDSHAFKKMESALARTPDMQSFQVAIMDDALMHRLINSLRSAGLSPDIMISEASLLFDSPGTSIMVLDNNRCIFCLSPYLASTLEIDTLSLLLSKYLVQVSNSLKTMRLILTEPMQSAEPAFIDTLRAVCAEHEIVLESIPFSGNVLGWLSQQWFASTDENRPINMLRGSYRENKAIAFMHLPWKAIILIILAWVVAQSLSDVLMAMYLDYRANQYIAKNTELYRQLFPQDQKIKDIRTQIGQHMRALSATGSDDFITLIDVLAKQADLAHRLDIQSLNYDGKKGELSVNIVSDDFSVLEQYKQLSAKNGFTVSLNSLVREKNEVHCQMIIRKQY